MTRDTYFKKLKESLSPIPEAEREEAISFYREYFEDAGNDEEAIKTLGAPAKLGAQIVAEYAADYLEEKAARKKETEKAGAEAEKANAETAEAKGPAKIAELTPVVPVGTVQAGAVSPYTRAGFVAATQVATMTAASGTGAEAGTQPAAAAPSPSPYAGAKTQSSAKAIWYIILGIFALPVGLPIAACALAVILVVAAVCFAVVVALVALIVGLLAAGIGSLFFGATSATLGAGTVLLSVGGALIAAGLLFLLLPLVIKLIVWMVNGIGRLSSKIYNKLKKEKGKNEQEND